jgi:NitT/TauT family transport system permease protein
MTPVRGARLAEPSAATDPVGGDAGSPGRRRPSRGARAGRSIRSILSVRRRRAIISGVVGIALWELVARVVISNELFFAPLTAVAGAAVEMTRSGELGQHTWVSLQEFSYGIGLAVVVGIPLGFAIGVSNRVRDYVQPWISGLYSTPVIALAPLFILWLGIGMGSKVVVVFMMALFPISINTTAGVKNTDQDLIDVARSFGLSRGQTFTRVLLPSALSFIVTGFRLAVGRGIVAVVVAEFFGSRAGLGYLILVSSQAFVMDRLLLAVLILALSGIIGIGLVERLERRLAPWREDVAV